MRYKIFSKDGLVNTIVADETFIRSYCEKNGYTYEEDVLPEPEQISEPTTDDLLNIILGVTK